MTIRMRKKAGLSDFKRGMVVSARQAGLSISEKNIFTPKNDPEISYEWQSVGKNALFMDPSCLVSTVQAGCCGVVGT